MLILKLYCEYFGVENSNYVKNLKIKVINQLSDYRTQNKERLGKK